MKNKNNKESFNIERIHFHIQWSYIGFAYWGKELNRKRIAIVLAGGPLMSLFLALLFVIMTLMLDKGLQTLISWIAIFNFIQFIITTILVTYLGYRGFPSDGLQLIKLLKK